MPGPRPSYRRRIDELRHELDDAEACADLERAARARIELDTLLDELRRASGLGGRARSFSDDAERARVSVHKAIKRALRMIAEVDPELGGRPRVARRHRDALRVPDAPDRRRPHAPLPQRP